MSRSDREKQKTVNLQEKHQLILSQLLKDDDNKYCVDCDAKGPRWASWNLGVFLCIRCAGIHRKLGVHISKVKSVNLDTWTADQIAMVQEMGNSRARAVYEANLSDNVRRPQTDSGLEAFIRAKYEQKKYIAREWVPPQPKKCSSSKPVITEDVEVSKKKVRPKPASSVQLSGPPVTSSSRNENKPSRSTNDVSNHRKVEPLQQTSATVDLLNLDTASATAPVKADSNQGTSVNTTSTTTANDDLFGDFISNVPASNGSIVDGSQVPADNADLFGENGGSDAEPKMSTKASIMALYGPPSQQNSQQMFGVPGGMYMPQQPQQQGMMGNMQNGMMGMQPNMCASGVGQANGMNMPGVGPYSGMMAQPGMPPPQPNMYNMGYMYNLPPQQQQQQQAQQMQQQMAALNMGVAPMMAPPGLAGGNWTTSQLSQAQGQTLSTNLWQ